MITAADIDTIAAIATAPGRDEFTGLLLRARIEAEIRDEHAKTERAGMARVSRRPANQRRQA